MLAASGVQLGACRLGFWTSCNAARCAGQLVACRLFHHLVAAGTRAPCSHSLLTPLTRALQTSGSNKPQILKRLGWSVGAQRGHSISQHSAGHFVNPIAHLEGGPLPILVFEEPIDVSRTVAEEIAALITSKRVAGETCVLGLATGSTPIRVYKELIRMHREEGLSFEGVVTFNLDEYYPMPPDSPQSYRQFMREKLFDHIDIEPSNTHVPDGTVAEGDLDAHCITYEQSIRDAGGIDLQILGLGRNGHIGFNEPGSARDSRTRKIHLESRTRKDAAKDFGGEEHVPTLAVSMGVGSILDARRVILMAFGEGKADIAAQAFQGNITEDVTASFLQEHRDAEVYLDREAAACLVMPK